MPSRSSPHAPPAAALIAKLQQFVALSEEERDALVKMPLCTRQVGAGEDLLQVGARSDCTLLVEGFACRYKLLAGRRRQITLFQIAGDFCDLETLHLPQVQHHVCALTPCKVALVPHDILRGLIGGHRGIAEALRRDTLVNAAIFEEWIANVGRRTAYQRIAHILCEMCVRLQAVGLSEGGRFVWPVTQIALGDAAGLSTVHVNRVMTQLRRDGLISLSGHALVIHDCQRLRDAADFQPGYLELGGNSAAPAGGPLPDISAASANIS